ncbi:MAG: bifunctional adenosylcobinamide kinase/adenosylcobinamide-phosphate guanylyltransferase [Paramuribaculum sp.]|nr:bifunctional adenosylcobinamide kinase/adenosylcobinamide-phosphate guanylyltransferase [Paramuribaculum sp.]
MESRHHIILITGGQRSGKSTFAEETALKLSSAPVYVATDRVGDEEFRERVRRHQERRGPEWTNIEASEGIGGLNLAGRVVLVDCITMWLTNLFFSHGENRDEALAAFKDEFESLTTKPATYIFVTNEIGSGGISASAMQRAFTDLEGWANQFVASHADEVWLMVCGIPMKVK